MKRPPLLHKTDIESTDIRLTTTSDKLGNTLHCVEFPDHDTNKVRIIVFFKHLSSALDFIQTNLLLDYD